jgi:hypothetical protein
LMSFFGQSAFTFFIGTAWHVMFHTAGIIPMLYVFVSAMGIQWWMRHTMCFVDHMLGHFENGYLDPYRRSCLPSCIRSSGRRTQQRRRCRRPLLSARAKLQLAVPHAGRQ